MQILHWKNYLINEICRKRLKTKKRQQNTTKGCFTLGKYANVVEAQTEPRKM